MIDSNHSAFPSTYDKRPIGGSIGLTKREYFAAMAMQGILGTYDHKNFNVDHNEIAANAVKCADALIQALSN